VTEKQELHAEDAPADNGVQCDNKPTICRGSNIPAALLRLTRQPARRLPLNRCNLPAEALASLAFHFGPVALELDGVLPLHRPLIEHLSALDTGDARAELFHRYVTAHFLLDDAPSLGLSERTRLNRCRLDYLRLLRGWLFDADGREAAVLKGWIESRFGLLTDFHRGPIGYPEDESGRRHAFEFECAAGLYGTGALEAQIDLLYTYTQHELARRYPDTRHITLYRGYSGRSALIPLAPLPDGHTAVAMNNLSSFSANRERADEFGDYVIACDVPVAKVLAFSELIPGRLQGEDEYLVIGGVMAVRQPG